MKLLKKVFLLLGLAVSLKAGANDFSWLTFKMTDGSEVSVASEGLAMTYNEGTLLLTSATVKRTFNTDKLVSMRFTSSATAVEGISDVLYTEADYFDLSGMMVGRFDDSVEARKSLPSGVYVVKTKTNTSKVIF